MTTYELIRKLAALDPIGNKQVYLVTFEYQDAGQNTKQSIERSAEPESFRLECDDSGYENVLICGDVI